MHMLLLFLRLHALLVYKESLNDCSGLVDYYYMLEKALDF